MQLALAGLLGLRLGSWVDVPETEQETGRKGVKRIQRLLEVPRTPSKGCCSAGRAPTGRS
jgi:hypothetical protein